MDNCFVYAYFFSPGTCYAILATDNLNATTPATDPRVVPLCSFGVAPTTQLSTDLNDPGFGGYYYGPCDINGPSIWVA